MNVEDLIDETLKEIKSIMSGDMISFWKQEQVLNRVKEAIALAYKEGRADEAYRLKGPTINMYE